MSFGPLFQALLEHRLYIGASKRPSRPQFEPRRRESLRLGSNRSPKRNFLATMARFVGTQTLYWGVKPRPYVAKQVVRTDFSHENSPLWATIWFKTNHTINSGNLKTPRISDPSETPLKPLWNYLGTTFLTILAIFVTSGHFSRSRM